jgi:hypothetical protein
LAQSPAIGGLTIRHPLNRDALERALGEIATRHGIGPENPVEAWIVSSTAGGTGEGIHRFVGAFLADFVWRRYAGTSLTLNFIRVGQLTYRTVNLRQTALNTFFGVAADAAFALKMPQDFPGVVTQWFYVDLPDVGTGERSIPVRAQLVELAAKAVMLEELQDDLQKLLVNNRGIPMVLTRTGYWGKDFGEQRKYYETLRQLREKLRALLEPDYERKYIGTEGRRPEFRAGKNLKDWMGRAGEARLVLRRKEGGMAVPPVSAARVSPEPGRGSGSGRGVEAGNCRAGGGRLGGSPGGVVGRTGAYGGGGRATGDGAAAGGRNRRDEIRRGGVVPENQRGPRGAGRGRGISWDAIWKKENPGEAG